MKTEITVSDKKDREFEKFIHKQIKQFNNVNSPFHLEVRKPGSFIPLNIILRGENGRTLGGLSASTYWDWLDIDDFFLPEEIRGTGIGSVILEKAEKTAIKRGCRRYYLTTFEFQAKKFYDKHGYVVVGKLKDYPPGSSYYWMRKDFPW